MTFIMHKHDKNHVYVFSYRTYSIQYTIYQNNGQSQEQ